MDCDRVRGYRNKKYKAVQCLHHETNCSYHHVHRNISKLFPRTHSAKFSPIMRDGENNEHHWLPVIMYNVYKM